MNGIAQFWWRGALGGALGSILLTLGLVMLESMKQHTHSVILLRLVFVLVVVGILGCLPGAVVGTVLCWLSIGFDRGFSFPIRILIGTVLMHLLIGPLFYFVSSQDEDFNDLQGFLTKLLIAALTIGGSGALVSPSREGSNPRVSPWPGGVLR